MIIARRIGDVTISPERHVAFAVNTEGFNDAGLAGNIAYNYWPELVKTGSIRMGEILSKDTGAKIFHALVVHSLEEGWAEAPVHIEACFNELRVPSNEEIASIAMGGGLIGQITGANVAANLDAMERSNKSIVVYDLS